jgi:hypothetical protein
MKYFFALLTAALFIAGCATQSGTVTLQRMPAWIPPTNAAPIPALRVVAEVRQLAPGALVNYSDNTYTPVSRKWLDQFLDWQWQAAKAEGITYTPESFDCEDFTVLTCEMINLAAARAGVKASPLAAHVVVQLDATNRHELMGVATDEGNVIVEPQPAAGAFRVTPLAQHAPHILSVEFGDFNPGAIAAGSKVAAASLTQYLPNPALTPGVADPSVTVDQLRSPAFIKAARNVPAPEKAKVYAEYGIKTHRPGQYEVDHLISLELGGSNDIRNLWPQSYTGVWNAHLKDRLENELHRRVLAGTITLVDAQHEIATNWIATYAEVFPQDVVNGVPKPVGAQANAEPDEL